MTTQLSGKTKKQAGLGDIDSRLAEIRDIFAGIFPAPPDRFIVVMFLLLYLEVFYGFLVHLIGSAATASTQLSDNDLTATKHLQKAIKAQYFYQKFPALLELKNDDQFISKFQNIFDELPQINDINSRKELIDELDLEQIICDQFMPVLSGSSLTPTGRLVVGTFLLIYLEVLYGFVPDNSSGSTDNFNKAASAIKQEYCYSLSDCLLHDDLKDKFEAAFITLSTGYEDSRKQLIKEVETQIFYRLNPLIPF